MLDKKQVPFCLAPWVSIQYGTTSMDGITPCCEWNRAWDSFHGSLSSYLPSRRVY